MNSKQTTYIVLKYLPINEEDVKWGMYVKGVGFQSIPPQSSYPAEGHPAGFAFNPKIGRTIDTYALVYLTRGEGLFVSSAVPVKQLNQGYSFMLFPKEWHNYRPMKQTGWDEYWVTFSGTFFDRFIPLMSSKRDPFFDIGINEQIVKLFSEMIICAQQQKPGFQQILTGMLHHILGLMYSITKNDKFEDRNAELIQKACIALREDIQFQLTPENAAKSLHMSYSNFRKLFKQYTGLAPLQYILQLKIEKAKELLSNTDESIKQIAILLNFESTDYFSYFFRVKTGTSPHEYRKVTREHF